MASTPPSGSSSGFGFNPKKPLQTPFDQRIQTIRQRLQGNLPSQRQGTLGRRLNRLQIRQYGYQQRNQPPSPIPFNPTQEATISGLNRTYGLQQAQNAAQTLALQQQYGFDQGFNDPTTNPFSRAALLQRSYDTARNQTLNSYASRGQLYAGSLSNADAANRQGFEGAYNTQRLGYAQGLQDLQGKLLQAQATQQTGIEQANAQALIDALNAPPDPSESPPPPQFLQKYKKQLLKEIQNAPTHRRAQKLRQRLQKIKGI